ncbi:hypothetical protein [endosymbiont GvMRE of Glomus versiforme]|uniref:hypothetical protein n=1 Tax=endosymbiont GvMRE of Glomus versiforme TaxID=2039283 RepID=UPI0011C39A14|nr:hypothetical protein [endosymbiont GvMRE of Glomus versiforme]
MPTEQLTIFTFGSFGRIGAGVDQLKANLAPFLMWKRIVTSEEGMENWAKIGTTNDLDEGNVFDISTDKIENINDWQKEQQRYQEHFAQAVQANNPNH